MCLVSSSVHVHALLVQALGKMAAYLGYSGTRQLMEDMLVTLVSSWMEAGLSLDKFPVKLMNYNTTKEFVRLVNKVEINCLLGDLFF